MLHALYEAVRRREKRVSTILGVSLHTCPDGSLLLLVSFEAGWWATLFSGEIRTAGYAKSPGKPWEHLQGSGALSRKEHAEVGQALRWLKEKEDAEANR